MLEPSLNRCATHLLLLVGVATGEVGGQQAPDIRYTWETTVEMSAAAASIPATRMTYQVKGDRQRVEIAGQRPYTILQCDLARQIFVDPDQNTCCVYPLHLGGSQGVAQTSGGGAGTGGTVKIEGAYQDTEERREMFGVAVRRLTYRHALEASADSCSYRPGRFEVEGEGWFTDFPPSVRPYGCTFAGRTSRTARFDQ